MSNSDMSETLYPSTSVTSGKYSSTFWIISNLNLLNSSYNHIHYWNRYTLTITIIALWIVFFIALSDEVGVLSDSEYIAFITTPIIVCFCFLLATLLFLLGMRFRTNKKKSNSEQHFIYYKDVLNIDTSIYVYQIYQEVYVDTTWGPQFQGYVSA